MVEIVARGMLEVPPRLGRHAQTVVTLVERYADVPTSLADASLVLLAGEIRGSAVLTLDADFHVYRKRGRTRTPLIIPAEAPQSR